MKKVVLNTAYHNCSILKRFYTIYSLCFLSHTTKMTQYPVVLYNQFNYTSGSVNLDYGVYPDLSKLGYTFNWAGSVKVAAFTQITLYSGINYAANNISGSIGKLVVKGPAEIPALYNMGFQWAMSCQIVRLEPTLEQQIACCNGTAPAYNCFDLVAGGAKCSTATAKYCNIAANVKTPLCTQYCNANPGMCDAAMLSYCKLNPNDAICTCINSPIQLSGGINPKCVDRKCLNSGYLTLPMQRTACPSIVTCDTQVTLQNSGVSLAQIIPIQQNCGNSSTLPATTPTQSPPPTKSVVSEPLTDTLPPPSAEAAAIINSTSFIVEYFYLILFLIILAIISTIIAASTAYVYRESIIETIYGSK